MPASLVAIILRFLHMVWSVVIVMGLVLIVVGAFAHWEWIRNVWFRSIHLSMVALLFLETVFQCPCPLTVWENKVRQNGGEKGYEAGFTRHWVEKFIRVSMAEKWYTVAYISLFAVTLLLFFFVFPSAA